MDEFMDAALDAGVTPNMDIDMRVLRFAKAEEEFRDLTLAKIQAIGVCATFTEERGARVSHAEDYPTLESGLERWSEVWILDRQEGWHPNDLRTLMYHELGHCLLDLEHTKGTIMDPYPLSVPRPWESISWETRVEQLFRMARENGR